MREQVVRITEQRLTHSYPYQRFNRTTDNPFQLNDVHEQALTA